MSALQLERLQGHLQRLRLFKSCERIEAILQKAAAEALAEYPLNVHGVSDEVF